MAKEGIEHRLQAEKAFAIGTAADFAIIGTNLLVSSLNKLHEFGWNNGVYELPPIPKALVIGFSIGALSLGLGFGGYESAKPIHMDVRNNAINLTNQIQSEAIKLINKFQPVAVTTAVKFIPVRLP
jgi:hypothetical protein